MAISRSSVKKQVTKPPSKKKKAKLGTGKRFKDVSKAIQKTGKSKESACEFVSTYADVIASNKSAFNPIIIFQFCF